MAIQDLSFTQPVGYSLLANLPTLTPNDNGVRAYVDEIKNMAYYAHPDWYLFDTYRANQVPLGVVDSRAPFDHNNTNVSVNLLTHDLAASPVPCMYRFEAGCEVQPPTQNNRNLTFTFNIGGNTFFTNCNNLDIQATNFYFVELKGTIRMYDDGNGDIGIVVAGRSSVTQVLTPTEFADNIRNRHLMTSRELVFPTGTASILFDLSADINSNATNVRFYNSMLSRVS